MFIAENMRATALQLPSDKDDRRQWHGERAPGAFGSTGGAGHLPELHQPSGAPHGRTTTPRADLISAGKRPLGLVLTYIVALLWGDCWHICSQPLWAGERANI